MPLATNKTDATLSHGDHPDHHNALASAVGYAGDPLADTLASLTNADPFSFGFKAALPTDNTTDNFDGAFFGVDVVTAGSTKAHVALQSVARNTVAGGNAWGFNALVVNDQDQTSGMGVWAAEFDVNNTGVDSDTIWTSAQNVRGISVASGGTKRPQFAIGVEKAFGAAPFVHGIRFAAAYDGATFQPAIWDGGSDIVTEGASLTHILWDAHLLHNAEPAFRLLLNGQMNWGDGTNAIDASLSRDSAGVLAVGTALQFQEQSAPAAPAANKVRFFSQDNGAGKTQLMALFSSGVAQQVAIQP